MLHIILLVLKIIGILLLAILGILVLLVCVVFFVPARYKGQGTCEGSLDSLEGRLDFSWLLHLVSGYVSYSDQKLDWQLRIGWVRRGVGTEGETAEETAEEMPGPDAVTEPAPKPISRPATPPKREPTAKQEPPPKPELPPVREELSKHSSIGESAQRRKKFTFFTRIKYTFQKICDTIKSLLKKKDKLEAFVTDEVHKSALGRSFLELKRIVKFLKPKEFVLDVRYGLGDPCLTGQVLAAASVLYPFYGDHIRITPDFEQVICEGRVFIKGHIRAAYFMIILWNLIWDKNIRTTYRHIKQFKF